MLLSIIIPIFKSEDFIADTLNSIYLQDFDEKEFEILAINDGTPDKSIQIVEQFKIHHDNLIIINQGNGGPGPGQARNIGLSKAKGEYIWFVDSDDLTTTNSLFLIQKQILEHPNLDIYGYDVWKIYEKEKDKCEYSSTINNKRLEALYGQEATNQLRPFLRGTIWCFIFKKEFLINHNIFFSIHILHEDMEFMTKAFFYCQKMLVINQPIYKYRIRSHGSIMSSIKINYYKDKLTILKNLENLKSKSSNSISTEYINSSLCRIALSIVIPNDYSRNHKKQTKEFIKSHTKEIRHYGHIGFPSMIHIHDYKTGLISLLMWISPNLIYRLLLLK